MSLTQSGRLRWRPVALAVHLLFVGAAGTLPQHVVAQESAAAPSAALIERAQRESAALHDEAIALSRKGASAQAIERMQALVQAYPSNIKFVADLATLLAWAERDAEALRLLPKLTNAPDYAIEALAMSARNTNDFALAARLYRQVLSAAPARIDSQAGLIYALTEARKFDDALAFANKAIAAAAREPKLYEARAFLHEQRGVPFEAMLDLNRVLELKPDHAGAQRKRTLLVADLGAPNLALQLSALAPQAFSKDDAIKLNADAAASLIRSGETRDERDPARYAETDAALDLLQETAAQNPDRAQAMRLRFDRVLALRNRARMQEAVNEFEQLRADKVEVPAYVSTAAADAYLYLEHPERSRDLYKQSLRTDADNVDVKQGLFYSYVDLDDFPNAFATIDKLSKEQPVWRRADGSGDRRQNWPKADIERNAALARGFTEMYAEGQARLEKLMQEAPNNADLRQAHADIARWRGHPRAAGMAYETVLRSINPEHLGARIGHAYALMDQRRYREAEREIAALARSHPEHKGVQKLARAWGLHNMNEVDAGFSIANNSSSPNGKREHELALTLTSKPIAYDWRLFARGALQKAALDVRNDSLKHYGVGAQFARGNVNVRGEVGRNDWAENSTAAALSGEYTFNDRWSAGGSYEKSSLQVPLRARAAGVDGDAYGAWTRYRANELTSVRAGVTQVEFDDGNDRTAIDISGTQRLVTRPYYHLNLNAGIYASRNTLDGAPYFNPRNDKALSVELENRWRTYRRFDKSFYQVLGIGAGVYDQADFSAEPTAGIRYQHEWRFNDRFGLDYGISWNRRIYDGEADRGVGGFINLNALF
jgi:biofilm PGA synthesis protein PgaA